MWWAGSRKVDAYLGHGMVAWHVEGVAVHHETVPDPAEGLARLSHALQGPHRYAVHVWLSARLAPPFVIEPVAGVRRRKELLSIAETVAPNLTGLGEPCRVWLDEGDPARPMAGVATGRNLMLALQEALGSHRHLKLACVRPWWCAVLDACIARNRQAVQLLCVEEPDSWTLLLGGNNAVTSAAAYWPPPQEEQARAIVARAALGAGIPPTAGQRVVWGPEEGFPGRWEAVS